MSRRVSPEKKLGQRIAELRERRGLSQAKVAETVGVTVESVSRLERGVVTPSLERLQAIAEALGVRLQDLFTFAEGDNERDAAMDALVALLSTRPAADVRLLYELAQVLFRR